MYIPAYHMNGRWHGKTTLAWHKITAGQHRKHGKENIGGRGETGMATWEVYYDSRGQVRHSGRREWQKKRQERIHNIDTI